MLLLCLLLGKRNCILILRLLLGKRNCILNLWNLPRSYGWNASTELKTIWYIIDFELCDKERMFSRRQTWEIRRTNQLSQLIQRMEEMPEKEWWIRTKLYWHSSQVSQRFKIPWDAGEAWMDRSKLSRKWRICSKWSLLESDEGRTGSIQIKLESTAEWSRRQWADDISNWL